MDRHDEEQVDVPQERTRFFEWRGGIQDDPRTDSRIADLSERRAYIMLALDVDREIVDTGVGKGLHEVLRMRDHQMRVEGDLGQCPDRLDDRRAHRQVGDEVAIHDVDVEHVRPGLGGFAHLVPQAVEPRGQDRGCDLDGHRAAQRTRVE